MSKVAVVLVRGLVRVRHDFLNALKSLKLNKKHTCRILEDTPELRGILSKVQDYATFGEVTDETISLLEKERGKKEVYSLHPPRGGFERKGIKVPYSNGGALGNRGDKMNELIKSML